MDGTIRAMNVAYTQGLHELGDGLFAYLQPDGGWGWSNAGLISAGGTSLLVGTLYDPRLTQEVLAAVAHVFRAPPTDGGTNTQGTPHPCSAKELPRAAKKIYAPQAAAAE